MHLLENKFVNVYHDGTRVLYVSITYDKGNEMSNGKLSMIPMSCIQGHMMNWMSSRVKCLGCGKGIIG